jgi:hypothetical protein
MQFKFTVTSKYLAEHNAFDVLDASVHASVQGKMTIPVPGSRTSTLDISLAACFCPLPQAMVSEQRQRQRTSFIYTSLASIDTDPGQLLK